MPRCRSASIRQLLYRLSKLYYIYLGNIDDVILVALWGYHRYASFDTIDNPS